MEVWAKKKVNGQKQTLEEHTAAVIKEVVSLVDYDMLKAIAAKSDFSIDKLLDLIFYTAYFHDIGKATQEFQHTINDDRKSFHSLYSASLVNSIKDFELNEEKGEFLNLLFLFVITHHKPYRKTFFNAVNLDKKYRFHFLQYAKEFFQNHQTVYETTLKRKCKYCFKYQEASLEELSCKIDDELWDDINFVKDKNYLRFLYSYVMGIINLADWIASAKFDGTCPEIIFDKKPSKDLIITKLSNSLHIDKFIPKGFQEEMSKANGNVLVEIPTGEGKTEGAYFWAVNNIRNTYGKIIYTLPTQTTSNKLYERTKSIFEDLTGLIHSSAQIYLEKIYEEENGGIDDKFKSEILFSKTFSKPVTVSTIDGVLKYFLNIGRYNIATFNILNSQIIIDEVHSYDLKLLGFLKRFLELTAEYKIPVCIMSASVPNVIKELLNIKEYRLITEPKLFEKKANIIIKVDDRLENNSDTILEEYYKGKNVLIVRNRIDRSISTYTELKNKDINNIVLYNSQFKKKDRIKKENEIYDKLKNKEHFILVATQVVEISLDINFDIMFTDVAPIDALIQRFGRINRGKNMDKIGKIYIFSQTDIMPYDKYMLELTFETILDGIYPINEYKRWLNTVYNELFKDAKTINELEKFKIGYERFNKILEQKRGIEQSEDNYDLRDVEYLKKDYILVDDYEKEDFDYENTVSLGSWLSDEKSEYLLARKDLSRGIYFDVLNLKYCYKTGVQIPKEDDYERFL